MRACARARENGAVRESLSRGLSWKVWLENPCISRVFGPFFMADLEKNGIFENGCTMDTGGDARLGGEWMAGRPMKYTAAEFEAAVERYFRSIIRTEVLTERVTEYEDGMPVERLVEVMNDNMEPMMRTRWLRPPSISGICISLGIERSTWQNYADAKRYPKHAKVCERARMRIECYLEELLSTKEKSVQGVIFNLQNNYWNREKAAEESAARSVSPIDGMSMAQKLALIRDMAGGGGDGGEKTDESAD